MSSPTFTIVAGPNGSGKTTFIQKHFFKYIQDDLLINVDNIAQSMNPLNNDEVKIKAARLAIKKRQSFLQEKKQSFINLTC